MNPKAFTKKREAKTLTKPTNTYELMNVLINWEEYFYSICISNHHDKQFKYLIILFDNYTSLKLKLKPKEKPKLFSCYKKTKMKLGVAAVLKELTKKKRLLIAIIYARMH